MKGARLGHYVLERRLGEGAMGEVWMAHHVTHDRRCALKLLKPTLAAHPEYCLRFLREARISAQVDHPNAIRVHDFGRQGGWRYIAMELLDGHPMSVELRRGPLELERALELATQLAGVMAHAHALGLVHRDLKPENVMLVTDPTTRAERAVVVDFGLAFIHDHDELGQLDSLDERVISGTPAYLSPEQAEASLTITTASDIYSLGCILYEMFTGLRLFDEESSLRIVLAHLYEVPTPMNARVPGAHLPASLDALVVSMLEKDPARRPTAARVLERLAEVREGSVENTLE